MDDEGDPKVLPRSVRVALLIAAAVFLTYGLMVTLRDGPDLVAISVSASMGIAGIAAAAFARSRR